MISRRAAIGAVTAFLLSLAWNGRLSAQFTTASLNGVVTDPSGAAVPGAKVSIREYRTGFAVSGHDRRHRIICLSPGAGGKLYAYKPRKRASRPTFRRASS